ncbi:MAG TPA: peptidoglycan DD-metalloendopeptidase family protein [Rickettsiales bacterium]|nr:peptidoglycan DD-metalloendopeptidase family protein [Rickettsiales bacterium]
MKKDTASNESLSVVMRPVAPRKLKRVRIAWFVLGVLFGAIASCSVFSAVHAHDEYSKRRGNMLKYAGLGFSKPSTVPVAPPPAAVPPKQALPVKTAVKVGPVFPGILTVAVRPGDTMMSVLLAKGIGYDEASSIVESLKGIYNPKMLTVGQSLELRLDKSIEDARKPTVSGLSIPVSPVKTIKLARSQADNSYTVKEIKANVTKSLARGGGVITSSLYQTAIDSGVPPQMIYEIISALSYDVDFQRDIQPGDKIDVVYERMHTDQNVTTGYGNVLYASLVLGDKTMTLYHHTAEDGVSGYYNRNGESVRKALLRTPINGAHITSGFGMRMHPLLGYSRMHKGIDFGAPMGTPIYAAGDGVIAEAGHKGGYGNYVKIRHSNRYCTAYGHASRIAAGIRPGKHVKQGQVIAYVGSTGRSTGPHLHYEILVNNAQVNPAGVKFRTGQMLQGHELAKFKQQIHQLDGQLATIPTTQVAQK